MLHELDELDEHDELDDGGLQWVGMPVRGVVRMGLPGGAVSLAVPLTAGAFREDVATGYRRASAAAQLARDLPRARVHVGGRRVFTVEGAERAARVARCHRRTLHMLLTQSTFALPFAIARDAVWPLEVCQAPGAYRVALEPNGAFRARKAFWAFDNRLRRRVVARVTIDNIFDPGAGAVVELEALRTQIGP